MPTDVIVPIAFLLLVFRDSPDILETIAHFNALEAIGFAALCALIVKVIRSWFL